MNIVTVLTVTAHICRAVPLDHEVFKEGVTRGLQGKE